MPKRELKKYAIQPARLHKIQHGFSNMVLVNDGAATKFAYIRYDKAFLIAIGKALPHGLSDRDPSYLQVIFDGVWIFMAGYLSSTQHTKLWEAATLPPWLMKLRELPRTPDANPAQARSTTATRSKKTRRNPANP